MPSSRHVAIACGVLCCVAVGRSQPPSPISWFGTTDSDFTKTSNWSGGTLTNDTTSTLATFATTAAPQPAVNSSFSVAGIQFSPLAGSFTLSGTGLLTLGANGIENQNTVFGQTISVPLRLSTDLSFTNQGALLVSGTIDNAAPSGLTLDGLGTGGTISGVVSGTGGLIKNGTGTWTISNANAFTGETVVNLGTLELGDTNAVQNSVVNLSGGNLSFGALTAAKFGGLRGSQNLVLSNNTSGIVNLTLANNVDTTYSGSISGGGALTKTGAGAFRVTGANNYSGGTIVNGGEFNVTGNGTLSATSPVTVNNTGAEYARLVVDPNMNLAIGSLTLGGPGAIAGGESYVTIGANSTVNIAGRITYDASGNPSGGSILGGTLAFGSTSAYFDVGHSANSGSADLTVSSTITGNGGFVKTGGGSLVLSGANTFNTGTLVQQGTLADGSPGGYSPDSLYQVAPGATLFVNHDETIAGLDDTADGSGTVTVAGGATLFISHPGHNTFSGTLNGGTLQIVSGGRQVIAGSASPTGDTIIDNGGALEIGAGGETGSLTGNIVDNGSLYFNRSDAITYGNITGTGFVNHMGSGTLTLTGANTYSGGTFINGGTLTDANDNAFAQNSEIQLSGGLLKVQFNETIGGIGDVVSGNVFVPGAVTLAGGTTLKITNWGGNNYSGTISGGGGLEILSGGSQRLYGDATFTGGTVIDEGATLTVGNGDTSGSLTGAITNNGALTINRSDVVRYDSIGGSGYVMTTGSGTLILGGSNSYLGPTYVTAGTLTDAGPGSFAPSSHVKLSAGTLNVQFSESIGGLGDFNGMEVFIPGVVSIAADATLKLSSGRDTYSGAINGAGALDIGGGTCQTVLGNISHTGGTSIDPGGSLTIGNGGTAGAISGTIIDNGTLYFNRSDSITYGNITGTGGIRQNGSGTLTLSGTNSYSGQTIINAGVISDSGPGTLSRFSQVQLRGSDSQLNIGSDESIPGLGGDTMSIGTTVNIATGATLTLVGSGQTYLGTIAGAGGLTLTGGGGQSLGGTNSYPGATTINFGSLTLLSDTALPSASALVFNPGANQFASLSLGSQNVTLGPLTFKSSAASGAASINGGSVTLSGDVTYDATNAPGSASFNTDSLSWSGTRTFTIGESTSTDQEVRIQSQITGSGSSLVKNGPGTLVLSANNSTFDGGINVNGGTLRVATSNAAGLGTIVLNGGTRLDAMPSIGGAYNPMGSSTVSLENSLRLADGATLGDDTGGQYQFLLSGSAVVESSDTAIHLGSGTFVLLTGGVASASSGTNLTFNGGGRVALVGATCSNISSIISAGAVVFFVSANSVPSSLEIKANGGYIGVAATDPAKIAGQASPAVVLNQISDKANFNGTFGFDTDPNWGVAAYDFNEPVDFSEFTNPNFKIGSNTAAILAGLITPPPAGYTFGNGGGGVLLVESNLTAAKPVSVVSNSLETELSVILRGNNAYPSLTVGNSAAVLDSPNAFTGSGTIALQGTAAYFGSTEAFQTAAGFLTFAAAHLGSNYNNGSILGFDSHQFIDLALSSLPHKPARLVSDDVDLSGFSSISLGTFTGATFAGTITAPGHGTLSLVNLSDGRMTIQSALTASNVSSVVIGNPAVARDGSVELDGANTYSGGTTVQSGHVIIGNSAAFGSGSVVVDSGSNSGNHPSIEANSVTGVDVANPIVLNTDLEIGHWYKGDLSDYADFVKAAANQLMLSGPISGPGGLRTVNGTVILSGSNSYSGVTDAMNGAVIFATANSIPAGSALRPEYQGYVGIGFDPGAALQSTFINHFDRPGMSGSIGFDSLGATQQSFSGNIDLSGFGMSMRLASATTARLTGTITVAPWNNTYSFGGGGGLLDVASPLTDLGPNHPTNVTLGWSGIAPLTLRLSSTGNTYSGTTQVSNGAIIFASGALPSGSGNWVLNKDAYFGTEDTTASGVSSFFNRLDTFLNPGTIGFDAAPGSSNYRISSNLDLSRFSGVFYVGSTTDLVLDSTASITLPSTSLNYAFSPYKAGVVDLGLVLADRSVGISTGLLLGNPAAPMSAASQIILRGANTYTGSTQIAGGTNVVLANQSAFSNSTVTVSSSNYSFNGHPTLSTTLADGPTFANAINLLADFEITGPNSFTLSGAISGGPTPKGDYPRLYKSGTGTLTLSGHNTFGGGVYLSDGEVVLQQSDSLGNGPLEFVSGAVNAATATFNTSATAHGIFGDDAAERIVIGGTGNTLTIDQSFDSLYAGAITSAAGTVVYQGSPAEDTNVVKLTVSGSNNYHGATRVESGIVVVAANNNAFGPSSTANTVTVNGGKLSVGAGVVVGNPIALSSGLIGGVGTFQAPLGSTGFNIGPGIVLAPGIGGPGNLTFDGSLISTSVLILNSGGTYNWQLMDAANPNGGWDTITVNGSVNIAASEMPFAFNIISTSADGTNGLAGNFDPTKSYNWPVLTATSIIGYTGSTQFNVVPAGFMNPYSGTFSLNMTGSSLVLNFSPIPEPSTYLLMLAGLAATVLAVSRSRRRGGY